MNSFILCIKRKELYIGQVFVVEDIAVSARLCTKKYYDNVGIAKMFYNILLLRQKS